jgi:hypothetical protein
MLRVNGKKLMSKVKVASAFGKLKGLMFEKKEKHDYALVFKMHSESRIGCSLHMLFVFFPIDTLFLSSEKKVVDKARLVPWQLNYTPKKAARYVVELPAGKANGIKLGAKISW